MATSIATFQAILKFCATKNLLKSFFLCIMFTWLVKFPVYWIIFKNFNAFKSECCTCKTMYNIIVKYKSGSHCALRKKI